MQNTIFDIATCCRKTTGDVPPKLVGPSSTLVGSKVYLFGGRLVTERKMVADLYMLDLSTFVWEKIFSLSDDHPPSRDTFTAQMSLVIFGGMSSQPEATNPRNLCVLNDLHFFDLTTCRWLSPSLARSDPDLVPRGRYTHLSSVTSGRLFIIGGQDFYHTWLDDICVFDLVTKTWVQRRHYPRHCSTYRSVAVSSNVTVRLPQDEIRNTHLAPIIGPLGARFKCDKVPGPSIEATPSESLVHLSYSVVPREDHSSDIYLFSNYNFADVKRELEVFSSLEGDFTIQDRSQAIIGNTFPPGLRFPTGAVQGTHLIIAGTYLTRNNQTFSIWALNLISMTWSRIVPGKVIQAGSWFRSCLWAEANRFLIFGNQNGNRVDDYNHRLLSWDHVTVVDLEAFGIYQPPPLKLDIRMQELGLAAFEERIITDFEVICDDGRKISCSRKVLEDRWPWFKEQRTRFLQLALSTLDTLPSSSMHQPLPEIPGMGAANEYKLDPRLTPRSFYLSESYPVTLAFLQYLYSMGLITPLQHAPAVLSQLLMLATNYKIDHLTLLVKHAMHNALTNETSVGVYEIATLCNCRSLQIRALENVMSYRQKLQSHSKRKDARGGSGSGGRGGRPTDGPGGSHSNSGSSNYHRYISRPRGTSDAKRNTLGESSSTVSGYNMRADGFVALEECEEKAIPGPFDRPEVRDELEASMSKLVLLASSRQHTAQSIISLSGFSSERSRFSQ
ncbi:hypothetical protein BDQ17DRAFT_1343355 [Cyathus striatus]|nr:hypothetical protein BDQ17DRAFT_1343355 [Cyathus striatus]